MDAGKARGPVLEEAHYKLFSRAIREGHRVSPGSGHHMARGKAQRSALLLLLAALPQLLSALLKPLLENPTQMALVSCEHLAPPSQTLVTPCFILSIPSSFWCQH